MSVSVFCLLSPVLWYKKQTFIPLFFAFWITCAQDLFHVDVLAGLEFFDYFAEEGDAGVGLAGEGFVVFAEGDLLDGHGADEEEDADEECGGVPFFFGGLFLGGEGAVVVVLSEGLGDHGAPEGWFGDCARCPRGEGCGGLEKRGRCRLGEEGAEEGEAEGWAVHFDLRIERAVGGIAN